jgi:hypothetical protein
VAKYTHDVDYFYKMNTDRFQVTKKFTEDLSGTETISSCTATVFDSLGANVTTSLVATKAVTATNVSVTVKGGTVGETYQLQLAGVTTASNVYTHYITFEVFGSLTLNSKLGDPNANSYTSLTEANNYIMNKYGHSNKWDSLSIEGKKRLLVEAAKCIDRFKFIGDKYYDSQSLEFPRDDHDVITGNCSTPITTTSFRHTSLYSDTYGKYPTDWFKYSTIHITEGTPLNDIRLVSNSNVSNGSITVSEAFTSIPATSTEFALFVPLDKNIKEAQIEQAIFLLESEGMENINSYKTIAKSVSIGDVSVSLKDSGSGMSIPISSTAKKLLSSWISRRLKIARR